MLMLPCPIAVDGIVRLSQGAKINIVFFPIIFSISKEIKIVKFVPIKF